MAIEEIGEYGEWTITVTAANHITYSRKFSPVAGVNPQQSFTLVPVASTTPASFTQSVTVGSTTVNFDMVYIPGGTFTLGCEAASGCPSDTRAVEGVRVSPYFIGTAQVTTALWAAVMGCSGTSCRPTSGTWYDALEFACRLSQLTGRNYRMMTEAEFEFAAKNHASSLTLGGSEEWAYNTWSATHDTVRLDPVGARSGAHDQKTRRNTRGNGTGSDMIAVGRLIRSIEGVGPALRLTLSANGNLPPNYVHPCRLYAPEMGAEPVNSYRDPRWVTGSEARWIGGMGMPTEFRVWGDGTATMTTNFGTARVINGQWFTSNNISFVFVPAPSQGGFGPAPTIERRAYIFLNETDASFISPTGGAGRLVKEAAPAVTKPTIANLMTGRELAMSLGDDYQTFYRMVDMENIPASARGQDERLLDGPGHGWLQINRGSTHHYRKDVDPQEFRFVVGTMILANGSWFTVNNSFLRVTHPGGDSTCTGFGASRTCTVNGPYVTDYLYVVTSGSGTSGGNFMHNSFMGYERGDFRSFVRMENGSSGITDFYPAGASEIPMNQGASMYRRMDNGLSTFVPAPCPTGGCR
jgi:hypothetical protein